MHTIKEVCLEDSLKKHQNHFEKYTEIVLANRLYATCENRKLLKENEITHSFKPLEKPPNDSDSEKQTKHRKHKKTQGNLNHIEATFGHLKNRFNLNSIIWRIPDGKTMQI